MGCGASSASGRDNYATLSPDTEPLTPLVRTEQEDLPRLNSFIAPIPPETPPESKKPKAIPKPAPLPPSTTLNVPQSPRKHSHSTKSSHHTGSNTRSVPPSPKKALSPIKPPPDTIKSTPALAYHAAAATKSPRKQRKSSSSTPASGAAAFPVSADPPFDYQPKESSVSFNQQHRHEEPESPAPPSLAPPSVEGLGIQPPPLLDSANTKEPSSTNKEGPPTVVEPKEKKKKKRKSKAGMPPTRTTSIQETPQPSSSSGMRFDELYRLKGVLGTGAFSTVREGYHRSFSNYTFAVKCVNRKKLSEEDEAALLDEVAILKELKHVHIIRLYDFFVESSTYYLVMERMSGGELFDRIVAKAYYNEKEARDVCKILLEAVEYCHDNHVAHRDLKPENLLLLSEDDDSTVKIADFGFAKKVHSPQSLTTQCGTPGYVAPEILEGIPYDNRADMWSVGVILYILLGGYPPFIENNQRDLFRKIRRGEYEFHEEYWGTVSQEAKDLISSLLTVDPSKRLNAKEALDNKWIGEKDAELANKDLGKNLQALTAFNAKRKFKAAVSTVMAVNKLQSLGKDFFKNLS